jgi:hypothetical protein
MTQTFASTQARGHAPGTPYRQRGTPLARDKEASRGPTRAAGGLGGIFALDDTLELLGEEQAAMAGLLRAIPDVPK